MCFSPITKDWSDLHRMLLDWLMYYCILLVQQGKRPVKNTTVLGGHCPPGPPGPGEHLRLEIFLQVKTFLFINKAQLKQMPYLDQWILLIIIIILIRINLPTFCLSCDDCSAKRIARVGNSATRQSSLWRWSSRKYKRPWWCLDLNRNSLLCWCCGNLSSNKIFKILIDSIWRGCTDLICGLDWDWQGR